MEHNRTFTYYTLHGILEFDCESVIEHQHLRFRHPLYDVDGIHLKGSCILYLDSARIKSKETFQRDETSTFERETFFENYSAARSTVTASSCWLDQFCFNKWSLIPIAKAQFHDRSVDRSALPRHSKQPRLSRETELFPKRAAHENIDKRRSDRRELVKGEEDIRGSIARTRGRG